MTIFGHDAPLAEFAAAMAGDRLHHGWLFAGQRGIGKATAAHELARELLVRAVDADAQPIRDHPISRMVDAGTHPDFKLLVRQPKDEKSADLARSINIEQIRRLLSSMITKPALSSRRVVMIDSIDDLERNAVNALLKALEEPPQNTIFILVSHAPSRLLPTIRSRCRRLDFTGLDDVAMDEALVHLIPELGVGERQALINISDGAPGKAMDLAGLDMAPLNQALSSISVSGDPINAERVKLAKQLALKSAQPRYEAFLKRVPQFIAEHARSTQNDRLEHVIGQWEAASKLSSSAVSQSLDPQSVVFALLGHVAALAPHSGAAKA